MTSSATNVSLINRIRSDRHDQDAWREFIDRYGTRVYQWCLNRKLQPDDAEDVTQEVLLKLAKHFQKFDYEPSLSFRGWLRRVTENAIKDFVRSARNDEQAKGGSTLVKLLSAEPDRIVLADHLAEAFDLEIMEEAIARVKKRVKEKRWLCWELLTNQAWSGHEVSEGLGVSVGVVYANKNQIQKLIKEEVQVLETGAT